LCGVLRLWTSYVSLPLVIVVLILLKDSNDLSLEARLQRVLRDRAPDAPKESGK
jgi:hypothetical protein